VLDSVGSRREYQVDLSGYQILQCRCAAPIGSARCSKTVGTKTLKYLYDFGDGWEHTIKIERLTDPEPGTFYPRLIEAKGRCPPEDIGGPWGYPSSSNPSPIPNTSAIANSKNGSQTT
jgi:hypothetical protein